MSVPNNMHTLFSSWPCTSYNNFYFKLLSCTYNYVLLFLLLSLWSHNVFVIDELCEDCRARWCLLLAMKLELSADCFSIPESGMFCEAVWEVSRSNLNHIMWSIADYVHIKRDLITSKHVTNKVLCSLQI